MAENSLPEVWLRGPLPGIAPVLQPAAHALLQAQEEVNELLKGFPEAMLWHKPAGAASVGFHLQHITGVLDRLFTYSRNEMLSETQLLYLKNEGDERQGSDLPELIKRFNNQVSATLDVLRKTGPDQVFAIRFVGRNKLPSTWLGLIFHAAEHTMRHLGQLIVTVRVTRNLPVV